MPFTLFKFPTLFGKKQSSYKLDRADILPIKIDLDAEVDPVILSHSKPSFTTFGYNSFYFSFESCPDFTDPRSFASIKPSSGGCCIPVKPPSLPLSSSSSQPSSLAQHSEYALEDILKSGLYNNEDFGNIEQDFQRKGPRKQRPRNPFYKADEESEHVPEPDNEEQEESLALESTEDETEDGYDEFQQLYDDLDDSKDTDYFGGKFEEIYENLVNVANTATGDQSQSGPGSFLPPEIYALHMESHSQRMGILSRYVETSNYSLEPEAGPEVREWDAEVSWVNYDVMETVNTFPRLDFIPSKETTVLEDKYRIVDPPEESQKEESFYQVPRNLAPVYPEVCSTPKPSSDAASEMHGSDSECESLDSGLETGGNSNLEPSEAGFVEVGAVSEDSEADEKRPDSGASAESHLSDYSEGIYENAAVLKSSNMSSPVTTALEKYEFGQHEALDEDSETKRAQSDDTEEGNSDNEAVSFQDIENFESGPVKKSWGVRHEMGASLTRVERSANPTEEIIAKEIRELKEREEELARLREQGNSEEQEVKEEHEEEEVSETEEPIVEPEPPAKFITTSNLRLNEPKPINNNSKFNPSLYGPSILAPRGKTGIMQNFLNNKGKVNAFKSPDRDTIVTLRKPQVYKSVPKVSPPVSTSGLRQTGNVLDKIQAELAETKRREDELRRQRRSVARSQPDLSNLDTREAEAEAVETEEVESGEEEEEETPSLVCTRGKSALISVWENRIQCEKAA